MYELKRWRIRKRDAYIVKGSVFNNPNFDDGSSLRTSPIISVERDGDTVIFHTMNSTYRCLLENHIVNCDDLPLLNDIGADIISESEISSLSDLLKARDEERIRNWRRG